MGTVKLERIALRGFLSHGDTDWSPNGARLVTLVGANGAGKSALASDAMRYALFDVARAKTDELVQLGATDMSVLVELVYAGARYRIVRGRTTKSGGKSYLELAVSDPTVEAAAWRPLTGDTIRDTQAAIAELLRLDADTFETAVLLAQGEANRFAEATAGDRKRILGTVLGLDRYARAEVKARDQARDVDARLAADRVALDRLTAAIDVLRGAGQQLHDAEQALRTAEDDLAVRHSTRAGLDTRIRELDAVIAEADARAADVRRLEAEREALGEDWHRANTRKLASQQAIAAAEAVVAYAETVDAAAARLPTVRLAVETMTTAEKAHHDGLAAIAAKKAELQQLERDFQTLQHAWLNRTQPLAARIATLEDEGKHAERVTCPNCGKLFTAGQDRILAALGAARAELKSAGAEPAEPLRIAQERAALVRLEERQRESGYDPDALTRLQAELVELTAIAARGAEIEAAEAMIAGAKVAIVDAAGELARISAKGQRIAEDLDAARSIAAAAEPLRKAHDAAETERREAVVAIEQSGRAIREHERAVATATADVARRGQLQVETNDLATASERNTKDLHLLRRLVGAFGVTGIPARIIESVLPELSAYANELLAELRPGMTLELRAQRASKDGKKVIEALDLVVRDDVGERGLGLFSGGERMSVSLAIAVGLSRLVARRAGTAIRTLVIDEPDGLDADARRAFGQALRVLAHHGELERVVLISHHEDLADVGDAVYRVTKNGVGSRVEQIA